MKSVTCRSANVATIKYPDRYSLKTDADRITEAENLVKLMYAVPGQNVKRELAKNIVLALLGGKIDVGDIQADLQGDRQRTLRHQRSDDHHGGRGGGLVRREDRLDGLGLQ